MLNDYPAFTSWRTGYPGNWQIPLHKSVSQPPRQTTVLLLRHRLPAVYRHHHGGQISIRISNGDNHGFAAWYCLVGNVACRSRAPNSYYQKSRVKIWRFSISKVIYFILKRTLFQPLAPLFSFNQNNGDSERPHQWQWCLKTTHPHRRLLRRIHGSPTGNPLPRAMRRRCDRRRLDERMHHVLAWGRQIRNPSQRRYRISSRAVRSLIHGKRDSSPPSSC